MQCIIYTYRKHRWRVNSKYEEVEKGKWGSRFFLLRSLCNFSLVTDSAPNALSRRILLRLLVGHCRAHSLSFKATSFMTANQLTDHDDVEGSRTRLRRACWGLLGIGQMTPAVSYRSRAWMCLIKPSWSHIPHQIMYL